MHETDSQDLSDDADYAASQQQHQQGLEGRGGVMMMRRSDIGNTSMRSNSSDNVEGAEVVYMKDNVTIHPSQYASERISGRLRLIKHGSTLFMTWIPYKALPASSGYNGTGANAKLTERDRNLYTVRAVSFTDVRSVKRHTPALGWQYVIVVLTSGLALPPFYFYNGGVREFLSTLKQHVFLTRSADDANVFILNDPHDPLQKTLSSLELPMTVAVSNSITLSNAVHSAPTNGENLERRKDVSSINSQYNGNPKQKGQDPARDLSIHVLEKFSLVTKFARETTSQLFRDHSDNFSSNGRKTQMQALLPPDVQETELKQNYKESVPEEVPDTLDPSEFNNLAIVWGKPRQPPLGFEEWSAFFDAEGRVMDSKALRRRIFYGGVEQSQRKEVWKFLLGYHDYDSTSAEREYLSSTKQLEYKALKSQWESITPAQAKRFSKFRERKGLIEKDVVRTDRSFDFYDGDDNPNVMLLRDILLTYSFYNFDLGYCQGMSDYLSPILYVIKDESESFWCFVALMERLGPNFNRDQNGMHSQLFALSKLVELLDSPLHNYFKQNDCLNYFFCFRWILIQFKREFEYENTMRLWEVLWTQHLSEHLHLYVSVAILKKHRKQIIGEQMDFDTLLKFINELSGQIDLDSTLREAEALCICAGEDGEASIPPGTPPSLSIETEYLYPQQDD